MCNEQRWYRSKYQSAKWRKDRNHPSRLPALYLVKALVRLSQLRDLSKAEKEALFENTLISSQIVHALLQLTTRCLMYSLYL